jgi:hypothetical protein
MSWCTVKCGGKRLKNIGRRLREDTPSVLCTQEHWDGGYDQIREILIAEAGSLGLTHLGNDMYYNRNDVEPVGALLRETIYKSYRFVSGQIFKQKSSGSQFAFFCTHWDYKGASDQEQGRRTVDYINSVGGDIPKLILGDFNHGPWSEGIKKVQQDLNFVDATKDAGNTWCSNDKKIDYIFHSTHWKNIKSWINREGIDCGCGSGCEDSYADHASLHAHLQITR